jgi:hypothetical protein
VRFRWKALRLTRLAPADLVVFACAASAGIHAGLVPEHLREEPRLGIAFALAVVALLVSAAVVAVKSLDRGAAGLAAVALGGLVACYVASRTTGIPLLDPEPEAVDAVGVSAVAIQLAGLVFALARSTKRPPSSAASLRGGF